MIRVEDNTASNQYTEIEDLYRKTKIDMAKVQAMKIYELWKLRGTNKMTREERKEYMKEYYKKNREKMLNAAKEYYEDNKSDEEFRKKINKRSNEVYHKDIEKSREINRKNFKRYYQENKEKEKARVTETRRNKRLKEKFQNCVILDSNKKYKDKLKTKEFIENYKLYKNLPNRKTQQGKIMNKKI